MGPMASHTTASEKAPVQEEKGSRLGTVNFHFPKLVEAHMTQVRGEV